MSTEKTENDQSKNNNSKKVGSMSRLNMIVIFSLGIVLVFSYSNCGKFESVNGVASLGSTSNNNNNNVPPVIQPPVVILEDTLGYKAMTILNNKCMSCHGPASGMVGGFTDVTNLSGLISQNQIIPGSSATSILYRSLIGDGGIPVMPFTPLLPDEILLIKDWIDQGALAPGVVAGSPQILPLAPTYASIAQNIIKPKCLQCHGPINPDVGLRYDNYIETMKAIDLVNPTQSLLYTDTVSGLMPKAPLAPLTDAEVTVLLQWIQSGAPNN
jgi:uncharacterized membrane protein